MVDYIFLRYGNNLPLVKFVFFTDISKATLPFEHYNDGGIIRPGFKSVGYI